MKIRCLQTIRNLRKDGTQEPPNESSLPDVRQSSDHESGQDPSQGSNLPSVRQSLDLNSSEREPDRSRNQRSNMPSVRESLGSNSSEREPDRSSYPTDRQSQADPRISGGKKGNDAQASINNRSGGSDRSSNQSPDDDQISDGKKRNGTQASNNRQSQRDHDRSQSHMPREDEVLGSDLLDENVSEVVLTDEEMSQNPSLSSSISCIESEQTNVSMNTESLLHEGVTMIDTAQESDNRDRERMSDRSSNELQQSSLPNFRQSIEQESLTDGEMSDVSSYGSGFLYIESDRS